MVRIDMRPILLALLVIVAGCASRPAPPVTQGLDARLLAIGDRIHWQLGCDNNPGFDMVIGVDGCAEVVELGKLRLAGLTLDEANHAIVTAYRERGIYAHLDEHDITLRRF
jgi:hypothetical protein